jgi:hypothetical protein
LQTRRRRSAGIVDISHLDINMEEDPAARRVSSTRRQDHAEGGRLDMV